MIRRYADADGNGEVTQAEYEAARRRTLKAIAAGLGFGGEDEDEAAAEWGETSRSLSQSLPDRLDVIDQHGRPSGCWSSLSCQRPLSLFSGAGRVGVEFFNAVLEQADAGQRSVPSLLSHRPPVVVTLNAVRAVCCPPACCHTDLLWSSH